jgi:hypothetical protein
MQSWMERFSLGDRHTALAELAEELAEFSYDGVQQLVDDLSAGAVARGSWSGCVISYRRGGAGSARRDHRGRARNAFTALWDSGGITDDEVLRTAHSELRRRNKRSSARARQPVTGSTD